jgi:hypothetical protein
MEPMKAIEFKSKLKNNTIHIPKKIQSEIINAEEKNVRVLIFFDDESDDAESKTYKIEDAPLDVANDELESINRGLRDFEEGKVHSNETARKLYEKYL